MTIFLKVIAGVLTAVILWLCVNKENKGISVLLSLAVCLMVITAGLSFFKPVMEFIYNLRDLGNINEDLLEVTLKVIGIGLLTELSVVICKDAGNESMAKSLQILSTIMVVRISIPVFEILLSLLEEILGTI